MFEIVTIDTPSLGDRSYLVHDGRVAAVVDPQRDVDRVLDLAEERGVRIAHVFETHVHNDYVTGGFALAALTGAAYHVNGADPTLFGRDSISDGDIVEVSGSLRLRAVATPGHTFTHLSYVLESDLEPVAVFTGGSLLFGSTGRPDLLGPENTDSLARHQHASAHRLAAELPDSAAVLPTHGFGSFCSATQSEGVSSTIGQEKRTNPALRLPEDDYVATLLAGLDAYPAYYAHMAPANLGGPPEPDLSPPLPADAAELARRIEAGEWVVDLRSRVAFAGGHVVGTLNFGLDGSFATYLGWLIPWGTPLTLLGETVDQVTEAQRELVRIGIDRPAAAAVGGPEEWSAGAGLATFPRATFTDLAAASGCSDLAAASGCSDLAAASGCSDLVVLDVRRRTEWDEGHLEGALHIPLHELLGRIDEIPDGQVWIHCRSGYRASLAASILARARRSVVAVDDDYVNAAGAGLPTATAGEAVAA